MICKGQKLTLQFSLTSFKGKKEKQNLFSKLRNAQNHVLFLKEGLSLCIDILKLRRA